MGTIRLKLRRCVLSVRRSVIELQNTQNNIYVNISISAYIKGNEHISEDISSVGVGKS